MLSHLALSTDVPGAPAAAADGRPDYAYFLRRATYYRLTASGRKRLKETTESWRRTSAAINRVLEAT